MYNQASSPMDQSMAASKTVLVTDSISNLDDYIYDPKRTLYRNLSMEGKVATIFDVEDSKSYYNWQLVMGKPRIHRRWIVPTPRFRELMDHDLGLVAFEVTGDFDGSISMICPSAEGHRSMAEELPIINFILTDMECYSSIEVTVVTINPESIESGDYETNLRKIVARNYRSRTVKTGSVLKVHFKLRSLWNYAFLNLEELVKDAWDESYLVTKMVKINANARVRRVYFSDQLYISEDLPKDFLLDDINPIPSTVEYFTSGDQYPPVRKSKLRKLYKNLREIDHEILTQAEYAKMIKRPTLSEIFKNTTDRQQDQIRGLMLSLTSKEDRSVPFPTKPILTTVSRETPLIDEQNDNEKYLQTNLDPSETGDFCQAVWNQSPNEALVEWDLIENLTIKPQELAQIHRQRRGEGFYDMYNAKMLETEVFDGLDDLNVIPTSGHDLTQKFRDMLGSKNLQNYMKLKPNPKKSLLDPDTDLDYLKNKEKASDDDICKNIRPHHHYLSDGEEEDVGSDSGESNPCSENESWMLTWTFDGMDDVCRTGGEFFDSDNPHHSTPCHPQKTGFHTKVPRRTFGNEILK